MNATEFAALWSGPPLVKSSEAALARCGLPLDCRDFLEQAGLPSNALWFDRSSNAIMSFDGTAILRELVREDVGNASWPTVAAMGRLVVLGIYRSLLIVAGSDGQVFMIGSGRGGRAVRPMDPAADPGWQPATFVNGSVDRLAACLLAYKDMRGAFEIHGYNFDAPEIRDAVRNFRKRIVATDERALSAPDNYWSEIADDVDVW